MKNRIEIIAKGDVQRVGYRDRVERIARKLNLTGFVENIRPYDVRIVAEGDREALNKFIKEIEIKKFPIFVEKLDIETSEAEGKYEYFEIKRGDWREEIGERIDTAGTLLYRVVENTDRSVELGEESVSIGKKMLGKQDQMLGKQDQMLGKQDQMLGKQDQMLGKQDQMLGKQDQMLGKQDQMIEKQDQTMNEIRGARSDLGSYMEKRFKVVEYELTRIREHIGMR